MKRNSIIASILIVAVIAAGFYFNIWSYLQPELIKTYLESFGVWMIIAYCLLYVVAVFIPHAGTFMTVVGGLLFAPLFGTALVITLSSLGSVLPFLIAKKFGRERVKAKIEKTKYKKYLDKTDRNSFMFVLYMRLTPIIPYELQNYIAGLVNISTGKFILATFIGLLPGTFGLIYLGNTIGDTSTKNIIILVALTVVAILIPIILNKYGHSKEILEGKKVKK